MANEDRPQAQEQRCTRDTPPLRSHDGKDKPKPARGVQREVQLPFLRWDVQLFLGDQCDWYIGGQAVGRSEKEAIDNARRAVQITWPAAHTLLNLNDTPATAHMRSRVPTTPTKRKEPNS